MFFARVASAYMKETAFYYYLYFIFAGFHTIFSLYSLVGIPSSGSAGIINSILAITGGHIVAAVFCIMAAVGWGIQGVRVRSRRNLAWLVL